MAIKGSFFGKLSLLFNNGKYLTALNHLAVMIANVTAVKLDQTYFMVSYVVLLLFFLYFQVYFLLLTDLQIVEDWRCYDPNLVTIIRSENLGAQLLSKSGFQWKTLPDRQQHGR